MAEDYPAMADERELEHFLFRWVEHALETDRARGIEAVCRLIDHDDYRVKYRAIRLAGQERIEEAVPHLEREKHSEFEPEHLGDTNGPIGRHATLALMEIRIGESDRVERGRVRASLQRWERGLLNAKREAADSRVPWDRKRLTHWRRASARLVEALQGRLEHTTADKLFSGSPEVVKVDYMNVYEFKSERGWTYRAIRTTDYDPQMIEGQEQTVLYDPDDPRRALLMSEYADYYVSRCPVWEHGVNAPITLEAWKRVIDDDPELRRGEDGITEWTGEPGAWFAWADGRVFTRNPTRRGLHKLGQLAEALGSDLHLNDKGKIHPAGEGSPT